MTIAESPSGRLRALGVDLPSVARPVGSYTQVRVHGGVIYTTGQLPFVEGAIPFPGLLGQGVSTEQGSASARIAALNAVAAAADAIGGIDGIDGVLQATGFLACAPGFADLSTVMNGASDVLGAIFGDAHTRSTIGVAALPLGSPVEIQVLFAQSTVSA